MGAISISGVSTVGREILLVVEGLLGVREESLRVSVILSCSVVVFSLVLAVLVGWLFGSVME